MVVNADRDRADVNRSIGCYWWVISSGPIHLYTVLMYFL